MKFSIIFASFFSILLMPIVLFAQENNLKDSVEQIIGITSGKQKIKMLSEISLSNNCSNLDIINLLEEEALKDESHTYLGLAYQHKAWYYYGKDMHDSLKHYVNLSKKEYAILGDSTLMIEAETILMDYYIKEGRYELILHHLKQFLDKGKYSNNSVFEYVAYNYTGSAYLFSNRPREALDAYRKSLTSLEKSKETRSAPYMSIYSSISESAAMLGEYNLALSSCDSLRHVFTNDPTLQSESIHNRLSFFIECQYASIYVRMGDLEKASIALGKAEKLFSEEQAKNYKLIYFNTKAAYHREKKELQLAKKYIDQAMNYCSQQDNSYYYIMTNIHRAKILSAINQHDDAYHLLEYIREYTDSISHKNVSAQIAEMQAIFQVEKVEIEIERERAKLKLAHGIIAGAVLISLLLCGIIIIVIRNAKTLKEKNKQLYYQFFVIDESKKKIEDYNLLIKKQSGAEENPLEILSQKLKVYMEETQEYKNPDISRDELAITLGTNRQYLIEAIKFKTGKTFNEYLFMKRLAYARSRLINDRKTPVAEICIESGFSSRATFNRLFRQAYGMNPTELRDAAYSNFDLVTSIL